jgi:hypothetical protein
MPDEHVGPIERQNRRPAPLVVLYLYVHEQGEAFAYPSARSRHSSAQVAGRYLECALVQFASLRLREARCDLALATNLSDRQALGRTGCELMERIEALDVAILPTPYRHRPGDDSSTYMSSRYVLDAILSAAEGQPDDERAMWLTDLDCVWVDAHKMFSATPPPEEIGCVMIDYPLDWDAVGFGEFAVTRRAIGELAIGLGGSSEPPAWVGGELLGGSCRALRQLVAAVEGLDAQLARDGLFLPTEEQVLSLAGAVGQVRFHDLSGVARRVSTGSRHRARPIEDPLSLALWHLPAEKGLSLRRAAAQIRRGRTRRLRRDLSDPKRMARRFNVAGAGMGRRVRDDGWILMQHVRRIAGAARAP